MLEIIQPAKLETTAEFICAACKKIVYTETIVEENGIPVSRVCSGTFRQALNKEGQAQGPIIPFCNCNKEGE